jgi:hypothetical protein
MPVIITFNTTQVTNAVANLSRAPSWVPKTIDIVMPELGRKIEGIMRNIMAPRRYTGALGDSVKSEYNPAQKQVTIGPTAKRGQYDAGLIAELGTKPTNVPWKPIFAWGSARGLTRPQIAGAIKTIRSEGVKPHPFLDETVGRPEFLAELTNAANQLAEKLAVQVFVNKP